ncbi:MAG: NAD(P)-binding domain-containing protein, partial [Victivallaceae bacterium]|nr:NAD(P)-binding domain-containing protein [Victivallaceae bacterium]
MGIAKAVKSTPAKKTAAKAPVKKTKATKADIGLIGIAVMGENLVLNMESKGFKVAVFNRTVDKVDNFVNGR